MGGKLTASRSKVGVATEKQTTTAAARGILEVLVNR
jgi:hypothetical protein